jgi:branched-subunit amino acid ABC-type transport system permease component
VTAGSTFVPLHGAWQGIGGGIERLLLRRLAGQELAQVLLTLGLSFIVSDL